MNLLSTLSELRDWVGDGDVVHQMVSEFRAQRCITGNNGKKCPHNRKPKWWEKHTKNPIAQAMKRQLELKNNMRVTVAGEDDLHLCDICGCCLKLKVHAPKDHLKKIMSKRMLNKTPRWCWLRKELLTQ